LFLVVEGKKKLVGICAINCHMQMAWMDATPPLGLG